MKRQVGAVAMFPALWIGAASGTADDDSAPATSNTLRITETEYEFTVEGELQAGSVSIAVENVGAEFHEIAMGKLVDGHTVDDVRAALDAADEQTDNPLEGILEDDTVIDDLGGLQAPGTAYTISGAGVEAGEYVLLCFLPNSEGVPHHSLGMVAGFTVGEGDVNEVPAPDHHRSAGARSNERAGRDGPGRRCSPTVIPRRSRQQLVVDVEGLRGESMSGRAARRTSAERPRRSRRSTLEPDEIFRRRTGLTVDRRFRPAAPCGSPTSTRPTR